MLNQYLPVLSPSRVSLFSCLGPGVMSGVMTGVMSGVMTGVMTGVMALWAGSAQAQVVGLDPSSLRVENPTACEGIAPLLRGNASGSDWMIGGQIEVFGTGNARGPLGTVNGVFENVRCYSEANVVDNRVFVASDNGSLCGWVARDDLLAEVDEEGPLAGRRTTICPAPRAISFADFCSDLEGLGDAEVETCVGLPPAIRAKGVIVGGTASGALEDYPFLSSPTGGAVRGEQSFFSILELHRVAPGADGEIMVLAGDGEGDVFGWIDLRALELWPTRLGLFYDADGIGRMFQNEGDLIENWRFGDPAPDISPGLEGEALADYIHGNLQLFSYPIVRTVRPSQDPAAVAADDVDYHEVIFFGQTGDGSVTQLLRQRDFAGQVELLSRLNLMVVVDTTESMRPYLGAIQAGLTEFIASVDRLSRDPANNIPEMRVSVHAYSDFASPGAIGLDAPITLERLMPPSRIGQFDLTDQLAGITAHQGLDDEVGLFFEAGFEAITQLSATFQTNQVWHEGSPSMVIHIADHGSRPDLAMDTVADRLLQAGVFYVPLVVQTDDLGTPSREAARQVLAEQAVTLMERYVDTPTLADLPSVDARGADNAVSVALQDRLYLALTETLEGISLARQSVLGEDLTLSATDLVRDLASSRIDPSRFQIGEEIFSASGLEDLGASVIVQASTAFAPLARAEGSFATPVGWTYTVALEVQETDFLRQNFELMCRLVGAPEQQPRMRALIVDLAEAFSGDTITEESQLLAVMGDLANMPGAENSFLAVPPRVLLDRINSTDPAVIERLRQDVCWISYHLGNTANQLYVRPEQLLWDGSAFNLAPGEEAIGRTYRDRPIVGPELDYLPSFFFVLPTEIEEGDTSFSFFE